MGKLEDVIDKAQKAGKKLYIRGFSDLGFCLCICLDYMQVKVEGYYDIDREKIGRADYKGRKCLPADRVDETSYVLCAVQRKNAYETISRDLSKKNIGHTFVSLDSLDEMLYKVDDRVFLRKLYFNKIGRHLDLDTPETMNEKLNWLKLHDHNALYTRLADKYEVKKFVAGVIGAEYVIENYGVWDSFDDIDFSSLPDSFILKCTHNSGSFVVVKDKKDFDKAAAKQVLEDGLRRNYFYTCREWVYKNIKPRIIADRLLNDHTMEEKGVLLCDYKFWCFNGIPLYMYRTVKNDDIFENFYDMNHEIVNINHGFPRIQPEFEKPENFEEMKKLVTKLAQASTASFVRVDLYNVYGTIYFSEFTFYDWAGLRPFASQEQDLMLGKLIELPEI